MKSFFQELNNRELAVAIWPGLLLVVTVFVKDVRHSIGGVIKSFFSKKVFLIFLSIALYSAAMIVILYGINFWNTTILLHFALKLPSAKFEKQPINAAQRISTLFLELLERQFPIDENHPSLHLRAASDYAKQLNVHVNHLNRAVKETTDKTTSQIIAERILRESKILLKHSAWNVSEISYALGFTETTHFNNFFKKHTQLSPLKFRNI